MFIKSLRIRKTTTDEIIREVLFHKGANLIVDTEDSESHNRVGKTTFLKLLISQWAPRTGSSFTQTPTRAR